MRALAVLCAAFAAAAPWTTPMPVRLRLDRAAMRAAALGTTLGAATWACVATIGAPPAIAGACGALAVPLPAAALRARRRRSLMLVASRWPDFLAAVRSRVAGGAPLPEATRAAGRHVGGVFADLDAGFGLRFDDLMAQARHQWADPVADRVFTTLATAATIGGGHVDAVLATLSDSIADELRLRRAHDAALTQQRLTAGVALVAPWAILALSLATNPTAAEAFSSPTGTLIIVGGLAATALGYGLSTRTARLAESPRLFA